MFEWTLIAQVKAHARPEDIWNIWIDVPSWPTWDHDLEWCSINGPFKAGTEGKLKPKGWVASKFRIISVEEGQSHSDLTEMPMTKVIFKHSLKRCENSQVQIIHHVTVSGLLAPLLWLTMRRKIKKGLPIALNNLAKQAESRAKATKS